MQRAGGIVGRKSNPCYLRNWYQVCCIRMKFDWILDLTAGMRVA